MALTRKFLAALGIEADKVDEIIEAHTDTVNALKEERNKYKADAEKLPGVQQELDQLKEAAEKNPDGAYKQQYEDLKAEYDSYKADVEAKETKASKEAAYRKLLKDAKVSEKRIDAIIRVTNFDDVELDKDGAIKNSEEATKKIKEDWSDFIVTEEEKGADTPTPPKGKDGADGGSGTSRAAQLAAAYRKSMYGVNDSKGE